MVVWVGGWVGGCLCVGEGGHTAADMPIYRVPRRTANEDAYARETRAGGALQERCHLDRLEIPERSVIYVPPPPPPPPLPLSGNLRSSYELTRALSGRGAR